MFIKKLILKNYRNYEQLTLEELHPHINVFAGENAQGKTNLIEAVNYLSCGKSFRNVSDSHLVREGQERGYIAIQYGLASYAGRVEAALFHDGRRSILLNGLPVRKISEMIGVVNSVVFAPEDLKTIKESPALRRHLMDMEISKIRPIYYLDLQRYHIILKNKNKLLKQRTPDQALLATYNDSLLEYAEKLILRRKKFLELLQERAASLHYQLTGERESLALHYRAAADLSEVKNSLQKKLESAAGRERELGVSLVGPHREDIQILIDGKDSRYFSSQGQQRTAMLSIKLACAEIAYETTGERPVILLDDVFSELDIGRRKRLLSLMKNNQVFITATDATGVERFKEAKYYRVSAGAIFTK